MKKTIIPLVLGFVGDTVVALVCEAFVGVVTKMIFENVFSIYRDPLRA